MRTASPRGGTATRQLVAGALVGFALTVVALALLGDKAPPTPQPGPAASSAESLADAGPAVQPPPVFGEVPVPTVEGKPALPVVTGGAALQEAMLRRSAPAPRPDAG